MAAFPLESAKKSTSSSNPGNKVGSYCFTRSSSTRYESLGAAKSDASSCTSYKLQPGGENKSRRVLSDITNNVAVLDDVLEQNPTSTPPRKFSLDVDSQCFSMKPRYDDHESSSQLKRKAPHACNRNVNKPGSTLGATAFAKCNGKATSKGGGPVSEPILRSRGQSQSRKPLVSREVEASITPVRSQSPPSKLSSLRKKILEKVSGKSIAKPKNQVLRRSISKEKEYRRLSLVLRNEHELLEKSNAYEDQVHALQLQCQSKEAEIESVRNVGKMLGKLCVNQAEELKALKGMFPPTLREVVQLRDLCKKQEQELRDARTVVPSLQEQVKLLTSQLDLLANDIEKVKAARLARRALNNYDFTSTKSAAGSNTLQQAQNVDESSRQPGLKFSNSLTENLGSMMERLNLSSENDLSQLEDTCARAFQELGFSRRKSDVNR